MNLKITGIESKISELETKVQNMEKSDSVLLITLAHENKISNLKGTKVEVKNNYIYKVV